MTATSMSAGPDPAVNLTKTHLAFALDEGAAHIVVVSSVEGESAAQTVAVLQKAEDNERATYAAYGTPALAELKEAVQASVMWLTVYTPYSECCSAAPPFLGSSSMTYLWQSHVRKLPAPVPHTVCTTHCTTH